MARRRSTAQAESPADDASPESVEEQQFVPVVGRTEAAQAEWDAEQEAAAEAERQRLADEAVQGGAGPGETGPLG